ncbi:MAG: protein jag [Anaerolineae bacterium]|nr:MAG: protein jag [Anaerolineae bacterium]
MIAPTVEEAIEKALEELGLADDEVEVEVLDEGSKGMLGIGARQARIRLTVIGQNVPAPAPTRRAPSSEEPSAHAADLDNVMSIARATVSELVDRMGVRAEVTARVGEPDEEGQTPVVVDVNGNDLSILIGKRAETLNALQYITRLIVGKEVGGGVNLIVDVEGYRERRERSLRELAQRMATQALKTGHSQTLEPMPPGDRRIIHMALQGMEGIRTESAGEEPKRKVVIIPNDSTPEE